ncbi:MAG TPA: IclR family transcriptional regulator C-terminal domain-containing protein [Microbacterium sp.]|uniref:IclR family transcriptional regulator domain-containing protein n=1 Tax=Microbacterium sp. TaxID=51671 RepID=UPI002CE20948|nr:IclR family transcriptional regulator C-terminal domain-containing protein [Microbacterium sp.]HWI31701.1 IclR family transcriptional regulator C-terminal domain-containing protein [Microbacterium sp.]
MVFIDQTPGRHRLRTVSSIGESFPLITTANGKATLALLAEPQRHQLAEGSLPAAELAEIHATGIAFDLDQHTPGVSAVGAAVEGIDGEIYSISVPVPSSRFISHREQIVAEFTATMARIRALDVVDATHHARADDA